MSMKGRLFLDTETTGLVAQENAIVELAFILEINGRIVAEESWNMKPASGKIIVPEALEVNGITMEDIEKYPSQEVVYKRFLALLDKYINKYDSTDKLYFYAYNAPFDQAFIEQWFKDNNNPYLFSYCAWPWIDVAVLASIYAEHQRTQLENFKLGTVCKSLGIEVDESKLHGGLYDVQLTKMMYERLEEEFNV